MSAGEKFHLPPQYVVQAVTTQRKPPAVRLWTLRHQSVRGRAGRECLRAFAERGPQTAAETCRRAAHAHALRGAVEPIGTAPLTSIRGLLLRGGALPCPIGLGQRGWTGLVV